MARTVSLCRLAAAALAVLAGAAVPARADRVNCVGGFADVYPCRSVDLLARVPLSAMGGGSGSSIWGWTDSLTGREYALFGRSNGTAFVDITDPVNPIYVGNLPTATFSSTWREIKTYRDHAFIVSEAQDHGMQVFDLTRLRGVTNPPALFTADTRYTRYSTAHTITLDEETGYAFINGANGGTNCNGGLHMVDVREPKNPVFAGCFSADGYTHDAQCVVYRGPDLDHRGAEICLNSNEDTITIVDVTAKNAPVQLARKSYAGVGYTHQGWLTEDHRYFLVDDELDEIFNGHNTRTYVWDVTNLDNPVLLGRYTGAELVVDHNQFVRGNAVYQANYTAGLRILDLAGVAQASLAEVAYFDVHPDDNAAPPGGADPRHEELSFEAAWSNYPYYASGVVVVSSIERGLFVLEPHVPPAALGGTVAALATRGAGCRNETAGATRTIPLAGAETFDCEAAGLPVSSGDAVAVAVGGDALASGVSGTVIGMKATSLTCRNLTTGATGTATLAQAVVWDCAATGLAVAPGDRLAAWVRGTAD